MKYKKILIAIAFVAGGLTSMAQSNLLNAKTPDQIGKKTAAQLNSCLLYTSRCV